MTKQDIADLAELIKGADLVVVVLPPPGDRKIALGNDLKDVIVTALQAAAADEEMV